MSWEEKVAFITGASQGIGRACALVIASTGAKVAIASRNFENLQSVAREIHQAGGTADQALPISMDAAKEEDIRKAVQHTIEHFGKIDILVNNAGITRDGLSMRMKRQDW